MVKELSTKLGEIPSKAESSSVVQYVHMTKSILSSVVNTFGTTNNMSRSVRSMWSFGLPLDGYDTSIDREKEQINIVRRKYIRDGLAKRAESIANSMLGGNIVCTISCDSTHQFRVMFDYSGLSGGWAMRQLSADGPLAGLSFAFVLIVMTIHTRSFAIASVGMLQILLSFPVTYFFYRIVLGIRHFGTLQTLAVYVILGIGADDIFVLYDAFMQAPGHGEQKMSWALRRAISAMAVTSLTTFAAFVVTALSPITNIKVFGIFAAMLVATNFILCCLLTPVLITLVHTGRCFSCIFRKARERGRRREEEGNKNSNNSKKEKKKEGETEEETEEDELRLIERCYRDRLSPAVIKYRWLISFLGACLIGGFGSQAMLLAPSDKGIG